MRRLLLLLLLLPAACADDPVRRIPSTDRALLEAEARLAGAGTGGRTSVAEMLARARGDDPVSASLVLSFAGAAVQPDAAQRARLSDFAARHRGVRIVVTGGRGDPALLGERRAVAVARALEAEAGQAGLRVELRFASGAPPDLVQIAGEPGTPLAPAGGR